MLGLELPRTNFGAISAKPDLYWTIHQSIRSDSGYVALMGRVIM